MGGETLMFHGCRSMENEDSISKDGFQVSCCRSGGQNYGSWFAYNASYSDGGYAFTDGSGIKHLFVCAVSRQEVVRNDSVMRVVGQDCAYPMWIVKYKDFRSNTWNNKWNSHFAYEVFDNLLRARCFDDDCYSCHSDYIYASFGDREAWDGDNGYADDFDDWVCRVDDFYCGHDECALPWGRGSR